MNRLRRPLLLLALALLPAPAVPAAASAAGALSLTLRSRAETAPGSGVYRAVTRAEQWPADKTAIIVCDMWDSHHCLNAVRRLRQMAPRMNQVLKEARRRGVLIIHAPSGCMDHYKNHPARQRALQTPRAPNTPEDIGRWCNRIPAEEQGEYPIDQSDGGEDDDPVEHQMWADLLKSMGRDPRRPWKSQTELLEIHDEDVISDSGVEIWSVMESRGIENVILMGVHANMCVLGRPFGLRQMVRHGKHAVLMRDMTDTMYNPARWPYVSHFTGTDLIIEHIEKWVCPTVTSDQLLGGRPFRFPGDRRPHLVIVSAEREYQTEHTLPQFARRMLGRSFRVSCVFGDPEERNTLPGIAVLKDADVLLLSVRRRVLPKEQMEVIRRFVESGKPVVGVRTASHAFSLRGAEPPEGYFAWEEFDHEVLGGNYTGHHGRTDTAAICLAPGAADHPILRGVDVSGLRGMGALYKAGPLRESARALLIGEIPDQPPEPVAWVNVTRWGGRVFYTSLAAPGDFQQLAQNRLLRNALRWAAGLPVD